MPTVNSFQELYEAYGKRKRICIFAGDDRGNYFAFPALFSKFEISQPLQEAVTASVELMVAPGFRPQWVKGTESVDAERMAQPYSLGLDCVLKYSTTGMDDETPGMTGAKVLAIKDLNWSDTMATTDSVTDRNAGGFVQRAATLRDVSLSGTLVYNASE
jgi:hypothetical protein